MTTADNGKYRCPECGGWMYYGHCYDECQPAECNGICLTASDIGLPEFHRSGEVAYAHPDCPVHGDPIPEDSDEYVCSPGEAEYLRYVREEDCAFSD